MLWIQYKNKQGFPRWYCLTLKRPLKVPCVWKVTESWGLCTCPWIYPFMSSVDQRGAARWGLLQVCLGSFLLFPGCSGLKGLCESRLPPIPFLSCSQLPTDWNQEPKETSLWSCSCWVFCSRTESNSDSSHKILQNQFESSHVGARGIVQTPEPCSCDLQGRRGTSKVPYSFPQPRNRDLGIAVGVVSELKHFSWTFNKVSATITCVHFCNSSRIREIHTVSWRPRKHSWKLW